MPNKTVVACVQNCAGNDTPASLDECRTLAIRARERGARLICLPEFCAHLSVTPDAFETNPHGEPAHPALAFFQSLAQELEAWLLIGSIAVSDPAGHQYNRSFLIDADGNVISRYDKIHMFDVTLGNGEVYRESDTFTPGERAVVADTPFGRIGMTVCYDLRFAALYRTLAQHGAQILTVPAAFTHTTGKAHWHVLLRSRAIETGSFVIAPCQYGVHGKARTYGHSLIINPWGEILAEGGEQQDVITADIDLSEVESARRKIPALTHDRPFHVVT